MIKTVPRRVLGMFLTVLAVSVPAVAAAAPASAEPASCGGYARVIRASSTQVLPQIQGNVIGTDIFQGSTVFLFRNGDPSNRLAFFGDNLLGQSRPPFVFTNVANPADTHTWFPGVRENGVMEDRNAGGYPNRPAATDIGLQAGSNYQVTASYTEECFVQHQNVVLGTVFTIN